MPEETGGVIKKGSLIVKPDGFEIPKEANDVGCLP